MSELPPPPTGTAAPPSPPAPATSLRPPLPAAPPALFGARPGDLTGTWRMLLAVGWLAAGFAYAAVWQASVQIGIATWWVGPRSQPTPAAVRMIPFVLVLLVVLAVLYNVRGLLWLSLIAAGATVLIAVPDFSRSVGLAVTELVISSALIVLSAVASTGRYRLLGVDEPNAASPPPG